jgi:aldehyde:ferredoxin oxidoreductase
MDGWTGRILRVDLAQGSTRVEDPGEDKCRRYIGGRGFALGLLAEEVDPATDPLGPENKLVLAAGPLTGTGAVCGSVLVCAAKSPLSGGFCSALIKGHFGAELKQAGLDAIVLEGKSKFPVYLSIAEGQFRLQPALQAWGRTTRQTESILRAEIKDAWKARETVVLSIGPAGERMCRLATLVNEDYLAQGGPGLGAVMGSKNLKAIAVRGSCGLSVARGSAFIDTVSGLINRLNSVPATGTALPELGSPYYLDGLGERGALAADNHLSAMPAKALGARDLAAFYRFARSCFGCPIGCKQFGAVKNSPLASEGKAPEADAAAAFGSKCAVSDAAAVFKANRLCTLHGLDPVSAGGALACAMELGGAGLISEPGLPAFGEAAAMVAALEAMITGTGALARLADGAAELCRSAGRPELFMGVSGAELAPFEPRAFPALGLHFATSGLAPSEHSAFGLIASALAGGAGGKVAEQAALCRRAQEEAAVLDSLGLCTLPLLGVGLADLLPMLPAATGWDLGLEEALAVGAEIVDLGRSLNAKAGALQEVLPRRLTEEPLASGPAAGRVCDLQQLLEAYRRPGGASTARQAAG